MKTPGIEVRPLKTMTGHAEFNEVFFTDVRVPKSQVVGGRGQGWRVANATLTHERGMLGDPGAAETRLAAIIDLMAEETVGGARLIDDPVFRDRLMRLQARVLAMKFNALRLLSARLAGEAPAWPAWWSSCRAASSTTSWRPWPSTPWASWACSTATAPACAPTAPGSSATCSTWA